MFFSQYTPGIYTRKRKRLCNIIDEVNDFFPPLVTLLACTTHTNTWGIYKVQEGCRAALYTALLIVGAELLAVPSCKLELNENLHR